MRVTLCFISLINEWQLNECIIMIYLHLYVYQALRSTRSALTDKTLCEV